MFDAKSLLDGLTKHIPSQVTDRLNSLGFGRPEGAGAAAGEQREDQPLKQVNDDGSAAPYEKVEAHLREGFQNVREGFAEAGERAKGIWQNQSTLGKTAIAGGLLGVLFSGGGRKLLSAGSKLGATALIGGLAYRAFQSWQAGQQPLSETKTVTPPPPESAFHPETAQEANELAQRILRAMVAAAKADGHVDEGERARIGEELAKLGIGSEAEAMIAAELDAPLVIERVAALARSPAEASQIYAATLLVIDETSPEERAYLDRLAAALRLDPELVRHLEASAAHIG